MNHTQVKKQFFQSRIAKDHSVRTLRLMNNTELVATWLSYDRFSVTVMVPEGKPLCLAMKESEDPASLQKIILQWFQGFSHVWKEKTGAYPLFRDLKAEDLVLIDGAIMNIGAFDIIDAEEDIAHAAFQKQLTRMIRFETENNPLTKVEAVIVCGGASRRMDGYPKGLLKVKDYTFAEMLMDTCRHCKAIHLNANDSAYEALGFPVCRDDIESIGPLSALHTAFSICKSDLVLIVPCDTPLLSESLLAQLVKSMECYDAVVVRCKERVYPTIGCYRRSIMPVLEKQIACGNYRAMRLLESVNVGYLEWADEEELTNINTPEDYERILDRY